MALTRDVKPMKSARHHWWPESLSQFWTDADGCANQLSCDGELRRAPPAQFGAITNAHHIKHADIPTPWDESFETVFNTPDNRFPAIVAWLAGLETNHKAPVDQFQDRLHPQPAPDEILADLIACIISLIVRSPRFRNSILSGVQFYRGKFGLPDIEADDSLIGMNMRHCQEQFTRGLGTRGKFTVLYTDCGEFIFGDGFFHNFSSSSDVPMSPRCVVPLTPTMSVLYARPLRYTTQPRLLTMRLQRDEVLLLNKTVQLYSQDFLFFRSEKPVITMELSRRQFGQFRNHSYPWFDALFTAITDT